jgi:hypothetical protein
MEGWGGFSAMNGGKDLPPGAAWKGWDIAVDFVVIR